MFGPKNRNERQKPAESKDEPNTEPKKKGGFGAFADKYRERWEAEHPNAAKQRGAQSPPGGRESGESDVETDRPIKQ